LKLSDDKLIAKPYSSIYNFLIGIGTYMSISGYAITKEGIFGQPSVMQVMTSTTMNMQYWKNIRGRRTVLITAFEQCVPNSFISVIGDSESHFKNPTFSRWYTTQLPCASINTNQTLKSKKPYQLSQLIKRRSYPSLEPWEHVNLIPQGNNNLLHHNNSSITRSYSYFIINFVFKVLET
jgi:hypothetical protein